MPETQFRPNCRRIAFIGVRYTGCTFVRNLGKAPARAIEYHMRVETLFAETLTATTERNIASSTSTQPLDQKRWARTRPGSSGDDGSVSMTDVPQPSVMPHDAITRNAPRI